MKLIKQSAELILQKPGLQGVFEQIEKAGRTCYKSDNLIKYDEKGNSLTCHNFVERMIKSNHTAMLEHATIYLNISIGSPLTDEGYMYKTNLVRNFKTNKYSKVNEYISRGKVDGITIDVQNYAITTNYRVIVENEWNDYLNYLCTPTDYHALRITFKVTTSIGVTRELNRHRTFSIAEQSTRYCNYGLDKFNSELKFILPAWCKLNTGKYSLNNKGEFCGNEYLKNKEEMLQSREYEDMFLFDVLFAESYYMKMSEKGYTAQECREILPLSTATEAIYTAFKEDWNHFFDLRYSEKTGKVHPNMKELATLIHEIY